MSGDGGLAPMCAAGACWRPNLSAAKGPVLREIILISVSGRDKPGVTSSISAILARYGVNILDIGQAVIHDSLSLGLLIEVPEERDSGPLLRDILFRLHEQHLDVHFQPITLESYDEWVSQQGKPRHIITLLARKLTAEHIARVTAVAAQRGLNIDNISRLSGRVALAHIDRHSKACAEFSVRGAVVDLPALRSEFMALANDMDVDIAFQEDNVFRRNRRLVAFDMDSTLIDAEVIDELAVEAGVGERVSAITERAMRGELDFCQSLRERVALLQGLDEAALARVAERLQLTEGAELLIRTLQKLGYKTAILSGGFSFFGRQLQQRLGIDHVFANELEIVAGKLTGRVLGTIVDGARKAALLRDIAAEEGINLEQVIAVGDGANDLPMLSIAGLGIAFRAKPVVRASAKQSLSTLGLDGILYLMGLSDRETV